ncbi:hypothetical protein NX784_25015 [Massilia pinisoli]|uniref:Uncharacterized protein n=1 Tax=Massilia pinisoli TaxID=1772194 RepID=A0ABT1ZY41_9BURK|nr:hypothetical protein [Massilia pinisoli]MCS0584853.1 hypothetical protein [Massilia pinisoli]
MNKFELSEPLAMGTKLVASETSFALLVPTSAAPVGGNDGNVRVNSDLLKQHLTAWAQNWSTCQILRKSMPGVSFAVAGKSSMHISSAGVSFHNLRVTADSELAAIQGVLTYAGERGLDLQKKARAITSHTGASGHEVLERFSKFKSGAYLGTSRNPAVVAELRLALDLVRAKIKLDINSSRHRVKVWFGKQAADEFMKDIRLHGLDVFCEQTDFVITWLGRD